MGTGDGYDAGCESIESLKVKLDFLMTCPTLAAAFLEFHEPLAAWLNPSTQGSSKNDTLLASGELYNNFVRIDVWFKPLARGKA